MQWCGGAYIPVRWFTACLFWKVGRRVGTSRDGLAVGIGWRLIYFTLTVMMDGDGDGDVVLYSTGISYS